MRRIREHLVLTDAFTAKTGLWPIDDVLTSVSDRAGKRSTGNTDPCRPTEDKIVGFAFWAGLIATAGPFLYYTQTYRELDILDQLSPTSLPAGRHATSRRGFSSQGGLNPDLRYVAQIR
jgi:hypothetical protein